MPHIVRRHSKDGSVMLKIGDSELRACTEADVRALLPIQAYSQKQLSNVSVRIDELTRFLTTPIRSDLVDLRAKGEEAAARLRQRYAARQRAVSLSRELSNRDLAASSLQEQAASIQASLTGLAPEDRLILDRERGYSATSRLIMTWTDSIQSIRETLADLTQKADANMTAAKAAVSTVEPEIFAEVAADYQSVMNAATTLSAQLNEKLDDFSKRQADSSSPWGKWTTASAEFKQAYFAAMQRSSAHKERVTELEQLNTRLNQYHTETARLQEQLKGLQGVEEQYEAERAAWISHRQDHDRLMDEQCQVLTQNSSGAIRATIRRFANAENFAQRLRDFLSGSNLRREKIDNIAAAITTAPEPVATWQGLLRELEMLASFKPEEEGAGQRPSTPVLVRAGLSAADLDKIATRLTSADWLELSLVEIASEPVFEYKSRENDYIPFKNASAGQQATALLKTLLNEVGPPLIIDQPEEDLDNPVISEIVEQIWFAKQQRQIIFASHNANLVVNGDAELVVWCDYRKSGDQSGGKIVDEGAIDVPVVREAIKKIMEGGENAFKARRAKYGF